MLTCSSQGAVLFSNLFQFGGTNGRRPTAGLIQAPNGYLYGTTDLGGTNGGYGTVFRMTRSGNLTSLVSFSGTNGPLFGANPARLVVGSDGNLYGTTLTGGTNWGPGWGTNGFGTLFRMTPGGNLTTLFSFTGTNGPYLGANPGRLIQGLDGNFYGTTHSGGATNVVQNFSYGWNIGNGTIFRFDTNGSFSTLVVFTGTNGPAPGRKPEGGLLQTMDSFLYGVTEEGGNGADFSTAFKVSTNGAIAWSFSFSKTNGSQPYNGFVPRRRR